MGGNHYCQCECVEGLTEKLKKFRKKQVVVVEKNKNLILGTVKDVDDGVLELINTMKFISTGELFLFTESARLFVSVCEIAQFEKLGVLFVLIINGETQTVVNKGTKEKPVWRLSPLHDNLPIK